MCVKGSSAELVKHPKVVGTPHLGANTVEAQKRVAKEIGEQFVEAAQGKKLTGIVSYNLYKLYFYHKMT